MTENVSYLAGFYPEQPRLIELVATACRGALQEYANNPEDISNDELNGAVLHHIAQSMRGLLVTIGSGLGDKPEDRFVIATGEGLVGSFEKACFFRLRIDPENKAEASALLKTEFMRYAVTPDLSLPDTRLAFDEQGNLCVYGMPKASTVPRKPYVRARVFHPFSDSSPKT